MKPTQLIQALSLMTLVAGATGPALAQSNVTIYGRINTTLEHQKLGDTTINKMENNSSRWGLKGSEDLGGGMRAGFQLESGLSADTGAAGSPYWGRQSEVNLSSALGTVRLGKFTSEAYNATADYVSNHNHDTGTSADAFYAGFSRNPNTVAYRAPEFTKGLSLEVAGSLAEGVAGQRKTYDFAANYEVSDLALGLGYNTFGLKSRQIAVRAYYSIGDFGFGGYVQRDKDEAEKERTNVRLSGMYSVGASEFHLNVGSAGERKDTSDSSAKQFTLGYNYKLSKRTKVYGFYTKIDDNVAALYGGDFSSFALGIRHNF